MLALWQVEDDLDARLAALRERQRDDRQEASLAGWDRAVEQFARAILTITGFVRHQRGEWRRRTMNQITDATKTPGSSSRNPLSPDVEAIRLRIASGDLSLTSAEARKMIQATPELARVRSTPAEDLVTCLVSRYYGNVVEQESIRYQVEELRQDLAGPQPTVMEALLAERAAVCWLAVNVIERAAESVQNSTLADVVARQRKIDGAHRRFMSAIKTLATVRKLALPDIKVLVNRRATHLSQATRAQDHVIELRSAEDD